jgi:hypothetical protein
MCIYRCPDGAAMASTRLCQAKDCGNKPVKFPCNFTLESCNFTLESSRLRVSLLLAKDSSPLDKLWISSAGRVHGGLGEIEDTAVTFASSHRFVEVATQEPCISATVIASHSRCR